MAQSPAQARLAEKEEDEEENLVLKHCFCEQFKEEDPQDAPPLDRDQFRHYVEHGPIQPAQSKIRHGSDLKGRTFQSSW